MIRNIYVGILLLLSIIPQSSYASKIKSPKFNGFVNKKQPISVDDTIDNGKNENEIVLSIEKWKSYEYAQRVKHQSDFDFPDDK